METRVIVIEEQTLAEAKHKATAVCEPGWRVISEVVQQEGSEGAVTGFGETVAEAARNSGDTILNS